ncbi:hypothetical protein BVRB_4g093110 [Beta vulgaris subsp. vulgaris]|uniref:Uncharacterized protein n=1 Tax=Beta vulgaris subsp. vulgaris TaxID=3555 RepID=A0A0J8BE56_BETVV|nr:hypothetical protein BVRB_4g093110 [Beta vulgaris subsp. vulgaris]
MVIFVKQSFSTSTSLYPQLVAVFIANKIAFASAIVGSHGPRTIILLHSSSPSVAIFVTHYIYS